MVRALFYHGQVELVSRPARRRTYRGRNGQYTLFVLLFGGDDLERVAFALECQRGER